MVGHRVYGVHEPGPKVWKMPPSRTRVLLFIRGEVARGRPFPSNEAIGETLGFRANLVREYLHGLAQCGHIRRTSRRRNSRRQVIFALVP